jgi:hypothetical protein
MKMFFRLQMKQLNWRERTYPQLLLDAPDLFEACRLKKQHDGISHNRFNPVPRRPPVACVLPRASAKATGPAIIKEDCPLAIFNIDADAPRANGGALICSWITVFRNRAAER